MKRSRQRRLWWRRRTRRRQSGAHYRFHKEAARALISERVSFWNAHYQFSFGRITIKDQKTCWGSCSEKKNLNFNYRLLFLPEHLCDYIVVHELCHLAELNHSPQFWALVERALPDYRALRQELARVRASPLGKSAPIVR